jgi:hypothetical protein
MRRFLDGQMFLEFLQWSEIGVSSYLVLLYLTKRRYLCLCCSDER